ncbi:MAG: gliding motility-associated C-terminal domain-containing protein [Ferruginibacter sp.]
MTSLNCFRLLLISSMLFIFSLKATSLNYFWIGNSGNWTELGHWATTSGGSTLHTQIPTALDDVFFDASSFTIPGQAVHFGALTMLAHNVNWTGVINTPSMSGPASNTMRIYGSLTLVPGMTMAFGGPIYFEATTTGQTITAAGKIFTSEIAFNGMGGGWSLQDALSSNNKIFLNAGLLNTNNQTVSVAQFLSTSNFTRQLNMGASVFNLSGYSAWQIINAGFSIQCGTSVINLTNVGAVFQVNTIVADTYYDVNFTGASEGTISGSGNFHDVVFSGPAHVLNTCGFHNATFLANGTIEASNVYNDLRFTAGFTYLFTASTTQTINGTFNATGTCSSPINIFSNFQGYAATISHPPATVNVGFVNLRDIHATGGANFLATNSNDLTNNTGWTFVPIGIQNFYWIGNAGDWSDGNHWSYTSGGAASGCSPTPLDNVFFDANSFSIPAQTVSINVVTANCRDMDWTAVTNTPTLGSTSIYNILNIYGSLKFVPSMNMEFEGTILFQAASPGQTITSAGKVFINEIKFNGSTGVWTLQDTFNSDSSVIFNCGTLNTNNQTVNADNFSSGAFFPRTLNMGSSVFNLHGTQAWMLGGGNINLNSGSSVINLTGANASFTNYTVNLNNYYDVNFTGPESGSIVGSAHFNNVNFFANGIIVDSCWFHTATFNRDGNILSNNVYDDLHFTAGNTYKLSMNSTQRINGIFSAQGTCGSLITITSNITDSSSYINQVSGPLSISNAVLRDIHNTGAGGATAFNSINLGNNTGWTFSTPGAHNLYWIGNGGSWEDGNHWSFTSGGPPAGCAPTIFDNVFFDGNSFSINGQTVLINITTVYCRTMDWTGALQQPTFKAIAGNHTLKIYGSLKFLPQTEMTMAYNGEVDFEATASGQTITTANQLFTGEIVFNGVGGEWTLLGRLATQLNITLNHGTLNTNSQVVNAYTFISVLYSSRTLNMSASVFNMGGGTAWMIASPGIAINCGTSVINCGNDFSAQFIGTDGPLYTYYDVNFTPAGIIGGSCNFHDVRFSSTGLINSPCQFHKADFHADGDIVSDNVYDSLLFSAGHNYKFRKNTTQTINNVFLASGTCGDLIYINSDIADSTATISHLPGNVTIAYAVLKDIHTAGGATFTANNSLDLGNNTGWTINTPANPDLYWIGNSGDWNNGNHWSLTSGGAPSGCSPSVLNNVIFDANSFSTGGQTVMINVPAANCNSMNWTGVTNTPTFASPGNDRQLHIYGSMTLVPGMVLNLQGNTNFEAITNGQTISMGGNIFTTDIDFNGSGEWILQDAFTANNIHFNNGTLNTNGQAVTLNSFISSTTTTRTLDMGSSVFNLYADISWMVNNPGLTVHAGTSLINCISVYGSFHDNSPSVHTYNDVHFTGVIQNSVVGTSNFHNVIFEGNAYIYQPNTFNDVTFNADGEIQDNNVFHDLNFSAEHNYILWEGTTQTVNNRWLIQGTCTEYILLQTNNAGSFATVSCAADSVFGHNIHIRDIHCNGTAAFMAYNSVDLGGNAGWNFFVLPPLTSVGSISGPTTVCAGSTGVGYQVAAVQGAINYQWTVPSGVTITGGQGTNSIIVDFGTVASGSFTVQACGGCGCSNTSVSPPIILVSGSTPTVTLTANPGNNICSGTMVNFTASATGTGTATVVYDFKVNNISVQTGSSNTWSTSTLADADAVLCTITATGSGCFTTNTIPSNSIVFTVLPALTPSVSLAANPGTDICSGTAVNFTATASNTATAIVTYLFEVNGIVQQSSTQNTYTNLTLADGDIVTCTAQLTNTAGNCFSSTEVVSNSLSIHTILSITPTVTIDANPGTTVCPATSITFTATAFAPGVSSIIYDFKINGTSVQNSNANNYTTSTLTEGDIITCNISLGGTNPCFTATGALSNALTIHITSSTSPTVTIAASPGTTVCPATSVTFTATANAAGAGIINYDFNVNGTSEQNSSSNTYSSTFLNGDVITCVISITGGDCLISTTAISNTVTINIDPNAGNVNVHAGPDVNISAGETVQLNAGGDTGTYLWSPSTGLSATNILNPIASPDLTTTYILTITNAFGCSASDDILITVQDIPGMGCKFDPMIAFTPNADGIHDKWIVYKGSCSISVHATVFNRYGLIVFQSQQYQNDWQGTYKGKPLPDGTYYFYIEYKLDNGRTFIRKNYVTILR